MMEGTATRIVHDGRSIRLKWHQLRRRPNDPPFSPHSLRAGLALGASMETDIQPLVDGSWVCLHDEKLEGETDGTGPVASITAEQSRRLRITGGDFPPPLLSGIAAGFGAPADGTCLQFDLKAEAGSITGQAAEQFASAISPIARWCLLSGPDWDAVQRLGARVPGLRLGFDPTDELVARAPAGRGEIAAALDEVLADTLDAAVYYLSYKLVGAALAKGVNPVARLKAEGALIDIWTLDPSTPDCHDMLAMAVEAGADQITTNDPTGIAASWTQPARARTAGR